MPALHTVYSPMSFSFPAGFEEDTLVVLKGRGDVRPSIVLRRVSVGAEANVSLLADLEEQALQQQVGALTVFGRTEVVLGGETAHVREVGFHGAAGALRQVQIALVVNSAFVMCAATGANNASFEDLRFAAFKLVDDVLRTAANQASSRKRAGAATRSSAKSAKTAKKAPAARQKSKKKAPPKKAAKPSRRTAKRKPR